MMGQQAGDQERLFYSFNLDDHVPADHLLRGIDLFLDLGDLRRRLAAFYIHTGRPSIDPELMIRMLIVGYCFGIRSERRLCEEVHLNLAYRWFCRLSLEDEIPDHSSFSKNRHGRFRDSGAFRHLFESVLRRCMSEGLVGGEGFAIDASVIKADANRARGVPGEEAINWSDPKYATRAVREYLESLDEDGGATTRKNISITDPSARWTAAPGGPAFYAYSTNCLIDVDAGIIVDVEATPALRSDEVNATQTMIERVEERFDLKPDRLIGDTAYGTSPMLSWLVDEKKIEPYIPAWDKSERQDGSLSRSDFVYNSELDRYECPGGRFLNTTGRATGEDTVLYRASKSDCDACALKPKCCPNTPGRKIARSVHEPARDVARAIASTDAYQQSRKDRKKVEMLFAHLKRILKLDRFAILASQPSGDSVAPRAEITLSRLSRFLGPPLVVVVPASGTDDCGYDRRRLRAAPARVPLENAAGAARRVNTGPARVA